MSSDASVASRLTDVRARIAAAADAANRDPTSLTLIAVGKGQSTERLRAALAAGQRALGENYAQELRDKAAALGPDADWHFIGHLQRNKVRLVVGTARLIHGVDSVALVQEIDRRAATAGLVQDLLVQVNVADEAQKSGASDEEAAAVVSAAAAMRHVRCLGLMTVPPLVSDAEASRPHFAALRALRDRLRAHTGLPLPHLSMGMSHDLEVAVAEGATLVRVGTAIFGSRLVRNG